MFEVGSIYSGRDEFRREYYLYVLQLANSLRALRGVVYDDSYKILTRRWFRVSIHHGISSDRCLCHAGVVNFNSKNSESCSCYPPEEVLDYFRNEKLDH